MADGTEINQKQYRELVRELTSAELKLKDLQAEASKSRAALAQVSAVTGEIAESPGTLQRSLHRHLWPLQAQEWQPQKRL